MGHKQNTIIDSNTIMWYNKCGVPAWDIQGGTNRG